MGTVEKGDLVAAEGGAPWDGGRDEEAGSGAAADDDEREGDDAEGEAANIPPGKSHMKTNAYADTKRRWGGASVCVWSEGVCGNVINV